MKLVRFGPPGEERPGIWVEDRGEPEIVDVRGMAFDISDYDAHFFSCWGLDRLRGLLAEKQQKRIPAVGVRLGPPIARPANLICVGKNYADHALEFDGTPPTEPVLFSKAPTSMIGPADPIRIPAGWNEVDAEAELGVVIGKTARAVRCSEAMAVVAGYLVVNDVTERRAQREGGQWFRGKSFDTFCPIGPWLVTADEVPDPQNLSISSRLNGEPLQSGTTRSMIFSVADLIEFITSTMTLHPGDVIATGTPSGVGFARKPPKLLRPGDIIEIEIERVGRLCNPVVSEASLGADAQ
ncbi:MAG: fumarylacetoacetate hydrolase family protein [Kiritimatiellae bacterium]|nr:fumarylacetoacetate hydrolase family protein [Kiritimatiellia bacterium]MDW8458536.1 fumarylacetoacetate hydrolase family protein [Verrucomicrobiota bacterium]